MTEIAPGLMRVDIGEPIARVHGAPQPVVLSAPVETAAEPERDPVAPVTSFAKLPDTSVRDWRRDYGLAK